MTATPSGDDHPSEAADENCPVDCTEPARDSGTARSFSPSEVNLRQNKKRSSSCGKVDINAGETDDGASVDDEDMAIVKNINNNKNKKTRSNSNETSLHEIEAIWRPFNTKLAGNISEDSSNGSIHNAVQETITMLLKAYDELIQPVGQVMAQLQERTNHIQALEQAQATKDREIDRLRQAERKGRESIANLIKGVETSNEVTRDNSQAKMVEAKMRGEIFHLTTERDDCQAQLHESERRIQLVHSDLQSTKQKLTKSQQAKMQVDRDYRSAQSMLNSLQGSVNLDVDYYKRKITELQTHLQGMSSVLMEKNREIAELRKDRDRHLSQNRLAALKAAKIGNGDDGDTESSSAAAGKKKCYTF